MSDVRLRSETPPGDVAQQPKSRRPHFRTARKMPTVPVVVIGIYLVVGAIGPLLLPYDPVVTSVVDRMLPPGATTEDGAFRLLGTDGLGRDLLGQVVHGSRTSVIIGFLVVGIAMTVGVALGMLAGFLSGWVDVAIVRFIDILMAFPGILLAIVIAGLFDRSLLTVILALSVASWVGFARLARGLTMTLRERAWVDAARLSGLSTPAVLLRHVLPFVAGPVIALATTEFALAILAEAGLSFLGLGLPSSSVSWGQTVANGRDALGSAWWISTFAGIALTGLVISAGLLGDRLSHRLGGGAR